MQIYTPFRGRGGGISIEEFLGEEICLNPIVTSSKVSEQDKLRLNQPLTLNELDTAILGTRDNSAAGPDGLNYGFL